MDESKVTDAFNPEAELERFVSQIEDNTFAILSFKQKFNLMKSNAKSFQAETEDKLNAFVGQIDEIEKSVSNVFQVFSTRLDRMEFLAYRPRSYHPVKRVVISGKQQITSAYYCEDTVYIGTDTSRVLVYSGKVVQLTAEIGPFDGKAVIFMGNAGSAENPVLAIRTANGPLYLINTRKLSEKTVIESYKCMTWPSNLSCRYRLATVESGKICLYDDQQVLVDSIPVNPKIMAPGPDRAIVQTSDTEIAIWTVDPVQKTNDIMIGFRITLISASQKYFAVAGDSSCITIGDYTGVIQNVDVGGPTHLLCSWGGYYFRSGSDNMIECRDFGSNKKSMIGDPAWWPHCADNRLAVCIISDSSLVTAADATCLIWS
jgi:hypothetical protein